MKSIFELLDVIKVIDCIILFINVIFLFIAIYIDISKKNKSIKHNNKKSNKENLNKIQKLLKIVFPIIYLILFINIKEFRMVYSICFILSLYFICICSFVTTFDNVFSGMLNSLFAMYIILINFTISDYTSQAFL